MSKHKIIHKIFDHPRPKESDSRHSDSSDEEPFQLHEVDCNNYFYHQNQDSLLELIDTLNSDINQDVNEDEPLYHSTNFNYTQITTPSDLQRINARYMAMMGDFQHQSAAEVPNNNRRVRFDGHVRAKYFSSQATVAQVFDAEQYTSFEQYQQTQDDERQP